MEKHHKCIQVYNVSNGKVFFKFVTFTTSQNNVRLGFAKYQPLPLYEKEFNGQNYKYLYCTNTL